MNDIVERIREAFRHDAFWDTDAPPLLEDAVAEIERLRAERRWIPVGERLPDEGVGVIAYTEDGTHVAYVDEYGEWGPSHGDGWMFPVVTHWMPLPEPPEVK